MRLDSALKKVVPDISRPKKSRHFLMHCVQLPDNFQMREHSWLCRFHISLSNLYNNVIIYNIKKSRENSFVCERNVQNFPIHVIRALYIDVSLHLTLTIQASSRLKRSANHLWNNSDVCRKKFGEGSPLIVYVVKISRGRWPEHPSGKTLDECVFIAYLCIHVNQVI